MSGKSNYLLYFILISILTHLTFISLLKIKTDNNCNQPLNVFEIEIVYKYKNKSEYSLKKIYNTPFLKPQKKFTPTILNTEKTIDKQPILHEETKSTNSKTIEPNADTQILNEEPKKDIKITNDNKQSQTFIENTNQKQNTAFNTTPKEAVILKDTQPTLTKNQYLSYITEYIKNHIEYPYLARKRGLEGDVKVIILINEYGIVEKVELISSSGFKLLDENTINYLKNLSFPKKPFFKESYNLKISYRLNI